MRPDGLMESVDLSALAAKGDFDAIARQVVACRESLRACVSLMSHGAWARLLLGALVRAGLVSEALWLIVLTGRWAGSDLLEWLRVLTPKPGQDVLSAPFLASEVQGVFFPSRCQEAPVRVGVLTVVCLYRQPSLCAVLADWGHAPVPGEDLSAWEGLLCALPSVAHLRDLLDLYERRGWPLPVSAAHLDGLLEAVVAGHVRPETAIQAVEWLRVRGDVRWVWSPQALAAMASCPSLLPLLRRESVRCGVEESLDGLHVALRCGHRAGAQWFLRHLDAPALARVQWQNAVWPQTLGLARGRVQLASWVDADGRPLLHGLLAQMAAQHHIQTVAIEVLALAFALGARSVAHEGLWPSELAARLGFSSDVIGFLAQRERRRP